MLSACMTMYDLAMAIGNFVPDILSDLKTMYNIIMLYLVVFILMCVDNAF